jgi:hypothetical protein
VLPVVPDIRIPELLFELLLLHDKGIHVKGDPTLLGSRS